MKLQHKFVDYIPETIENDTLYISLDFGTVVHNCACGCGNEVNTPLSPIHWKMIYNGEAITLKPSIGNWSFECKSHYWITNNIVEWSYKWSKSKIQKNRNAEKLEAQKYYENQEPNKEKDLHSTIDVVKINDVPKAKNWLQKLIFWK